MKKLIVFLGFLALGIYLFVNVVVSTGVTTIVATISDFSLVYFAFICALTAFNFVVYAYRWRVILNHFAPKNKVSFRSLYMARFSGYAVSYLTPSAQVGGEPVRIFFLTDDGVKTKAAVASVVTDKVLESVAFILLSVIGVIIGFWYGLFDGTIGTILWRMLIGTLIFLAILGYAIFFKSGFISKLMRVFHLTKFKKLQKIERKIAEIEHLMSDFCTGHYLRLAWLMFLSVFNVVIYMLEHFFLALFLGVMLGVMESFLVTAVPNIAYLIPIPAALGALESFHVGVFDVLGISINAVALVLILRIRDILVVFTGIIYASGHGLHMVRDAFRELRDSFKS